MAIEINFEEGCSECYKSFEKGDAIGFRLIEVKNLGKRNSLELTPVHLKHLIGHSHIQNSITQFNDLG